MRASNAVVHLLSILGVLAAAAADAPAPGAVGPQRIRSYRHLARLLNEKQPQYLFNVADAKTGTVLTTVSTIGTNAPGAAGGVEGGGAGDAQFSVTNVQVAGVDEADIVKTDGEFIYQVNRERVLVVKAYPDNELELKSRLNFESEFIPYELFVDEGLLVVIGSAMRTTPVERGISVTPPTVKAVVVDVTDASDCKVVREVEVDGGYLSSRKVGHCVYLVVRKYPDFYLLPVMGGNQAGGAVARAGKTGRRRPRGLVPALRDTAEKTRPRRIPPRDVFYFPGFNEPDYVLVAGFDLADPEKRVSVRALLGAGEAVYASREHLYVADTEWLPSMGGPLLLGSTGVRPAAAPREEPQQKTSIYRFDIGGGEVSFDVRGEVPGTVLNQFAMDEYSGRFRVATTTRDAAWTPSNNLYVLNGDMAIEGRLEGLAPGEQIFSTRFIGDRCYMVTFRMVDPLFVISTADPAAPVVLGQLKIPGFSNYLHPYDDNHILGFGKDAVEGLYQGMKIACFDVSDVANPIQEHAITIGDRGTDSELLRNHKALLFDKEKALLAFPVTVAEIKNKTPDMPAWTYGDLVFQGAYAYNFTLEAGFVFRKAITHQGADQIGQFIWEADVRRLLYIDTSLYSVSDSQIKVHDLGTFEEKRALLLPP